MKSSRDNLSAFHKGQILTEGLILVREDICDWINKLFKAEIITGETFLTTLQDGIVLCDLVFQIYQHISTQMPFKWPKQPPTPDRRAKVGSFNAKDNISLFLNWCRGIGLSNTILFETRGLTNSDEEKNIVLTLLHIGEVCADFNMPLPEFAKYYKEMMLAKSKLTHTTSVYTLGDTSDLGSMESDSISARSDSNIFDDSESSLSQVNEKISAKTSGNEQSAGPRIIISRDAEDKPVQSKSKKKPSPTAADQLVDETFNILIKEINNRCQCQTKFCIEKTTLQEGMYKIGSKNIFVRMFRGNVMLRVGGGWETLNEYLNKVDPCCKSDTKPNSMYTRRQSMATSTISTDLPTDGIITKNLRKLSECELITVRKKTYFQKYAGSPELFRQNFSITETSFFNHD